MANENDNDRDERDDDETSDEGSADESSSASSSDAASPEELSAEEQDRIAAREAAEIQREDASLSEGSEHDVAPLTGLMGVERWVQFSFIALAGIIVFTADQLIQTIWGYFAEPDPTIVSGAAALLGLVIAFVAYRHPRTNELAREVVGELSKVTWPTRDETYYSTMVVIVTSIIAAVYTGVFDAVWSAFTDLIYNV